MMIVWRLVILVNEVILMRLEFSNPSIFKDIFESIGHIVDEVKIVASNDGLRVDALDKSHITFVNLVLQPSLFDEYECVDIEELLVDTQELMNTLKRCKNDDILKLETTDGKLVLRFDGDASRTFKLRLIHEEYESPVPPSIDYPVTLTIPSVLVKDSLSDCRLYGENLQIGRAHV